MGSSPPSCTGACRPCARRSCGDDDLTVEVCIADPSFGPTDEQLGERFNRASADVDRKHCESLAGLRVEIAVSG